MLVFRVSTVTVTALLLLLLGEVSVPVLVRKVVCPEQIYRGLLRFLNANALSQTQNYLIPFFCIDFSINTLWTGDADSRLYITTVQDG